MHQINFVAALVAALSGFFIGGLWYGPLFRKPWMRFSGMTFEAGKQQNVALVFGGAYVLNFVTACGLSLLLAGQRGWLIGLHTGALTGACFVATALGIIYLFESRPLGLWAVNAGYVVVNFGAMGSILGAWPW